MLKMISVLLITGVLVTFLAQPVLAVDGKKMYTAKFCITCHGKQGISVAPNYPNLSGQNPEYMKIQARDIINGKRKSKLTLLMTANPVVMNISDVEIAEIAEYLATLK